MQADQSSPPGVLGLNEGLGVMSLRSVRGPIERSAYAASGLAFDHLDGSLTVSLEWLRDYSRLLLQQACEARLHGLGIRGEGGIARDAVEDYLTPNDRLTG